MRSRVTIIMIWSICLASVVAVNAQKATRVPVDEVLPMMAAQDDSPLTIERFAVVIGPNAQYDWIYRVRNVSSKSVKSYRLAHFFDNGSGFMGYGVMPPNKLLLAGESTGTFDSIEYSKEVRKHTGPLRLIALAMIVEVTFEDGTMFSATKLYDSFKNRLINYGIEP